MNQCAGGPTRDVFSTQHAAGNDRACVTCNSEREHEVGQHASCIMYASEGVYNARSLHGHIHIDNGHIRIVKEVRGVVVFGDIGA